MNYYLIVDIGNSQTELAIFDNEKLLDKIRFDTPKFNIDYDNQKLSNFFKKNNLKPNDFSGGMIFSVVPKLTHLIQIILKGEFGIDIQIFNPIETIKSLKCNIDNPNEIGQDLLADIVGGLHYYQYPVVICDLGTVTKNIIIDKDGVFQGVSFFPGLMINANSLSDKTAQLPSLNIVDKPRLFFGKNTIDAMSSGVYYGHVSMIKEFMKQTEEYFGYEFKKVITGGFSKTFVDDFDEKYVIDQELVLRGMFLIYKKVNNL